MKIDPLSPRLQAIADLVDVGASMADIGSDHARLPIYLLANGLVPAAIASELGEGPYQRTLAAVCSNNLQEYIKVRQGDGLQTLREGETATVVIAGMGGENIAAILAYDWNKAESFGKYILQPMTKASVLRKTLAGQGWPIIQEKLLWDNNRYVIIIVSQPGGTPYCLNELEEDIGCDALQANNQIKREYLFKFMEKYTRIYKGLKHSAQQDKQLLANSYRDKLERLELILGAGNGPRY
jgi:tRNA (adenine22-N1)-methyltransferase